MLRKVFITLNVISIICLGLSVLSAYVSPMVFWPLAFLGLGFPYILFVNVLFIPFWFIFKKKLVWLPIAAFVLSLPFLMRVFIITLPSEDAEQIKVMSWNVKNFDLYNWSHNLETRERMLSLIEDESPDILCLQEFYTEDGGSMKNIEGVMARVGYEFYTFEKVLTLQGNRHWGITTFSKFPIVDQGRISFSNSDFNVAIYTDVNVNGQPLRVYNTHLQSIKLGDEDYKYLSQLDSDQKPDLHSTQRIVGKMKLGFQARAVQVEELKAHMADYDGLKMVCGDFNDTPISYTYQTMVKGLKDSYKARGFSFGRTYVSKIPNLRIDYVMVDKAIKVLDYDRHEERLSDHYALSVMLKLPD